MGNHICKESLLDYLYEQIANCRYGFYDLDESLTRAFEMVAQEVERGRFDVENVMSVPIDRAWQDMFCEHLFEMGFNCYGNPIDDKDETLRSLERNVEGSEGGTFYCYENDTFRIMPYYWGDDEEISEMPNFVYKPTGYRLKWYKYALRDSYANQDVTYVQLDEMLRKCRESLGVSANDES
ncbi:hypothetical protein PACILC2_34660 [Paenibacillus cisolokensis]|uniref:Uncharacterized protein n=1 Tax=Paenibacillus cisolokensis TaxID=1658519 RepID=A0ABQ4N9H3_9BACL|nr:hypothetical protein [Paenibacillus cisolokensis]GIQ64898.1 hypothetical protein PACILC2_34660 [Paenibacillus cisolokensis]